MTTAPAYAPNRDLDAANGPFQPEGYRLDQLLELAGRLKAEPHLVGHHIRSIRENEQRLVDIAQKSYWHPNGFAKIRVVELDHFSARLHIWPAGENRLGDVDPHSHRWEFASWVAAGEGLSETYFEEADSGDPLSVDYVLHDYRRDADGFGRLETPTPARLRESADRRHGPGEVYQCPLDVVHTVAPFGTSLVATVLLQGPVLIDSAKVFRRSEMSSTTEEAALSVADLEQLFLDLEGGLAESG